MVPTKDKFCPRPFLHAEMGADRTLRFCPAAWQATMPGRVDAGLWEAWNSPVAQAIRRSIIEGRYTYCNKIACPQLQANGCLARRDDVADGFLRGVIDAATVELGVGPRDVSLHLAEAEDAAALAETLSSGLRDVMYLTLHDAGAGEAAPAYVEFVKRFDWAKHLSLKVNLDTAGQRFTQQTWDALGACHPSMNGLHLRINATAASTFRKLNAGACFGAVLRNLRLVKHLRGAEALRWVTLVFDVNRHNFREMADFVYLARDMGADSVLFDHVQPGGGVPTIEVARNAMHLETHPFHDEFLAILDDPVFRDPIVNMSQLRPLVNGPGNMRAQVVPEPVRRIAREIWWRAVMVGDEGAAFFRSMHFGQALAW